MPNSSLLPEIKLDTYTLRARLLPVLVVAVPGFLAALAWIPAAWSWWETAGGLVLGAGIPAFLAELGRDRGKRKEQGLFQSWGGKPTTRLLRHRDADNPVMLKRRHARLQELIPDITLPTEEEEAADPAGADQVYDTCVSFLREKTRDKSKFRVLFSENCSYGFRRNLWGMKVLGIAIAVVSAGAIVGVIFVRGVGSALTPSVLGGGAISLLLLIAWVFVVKPSWVRVAAEAYAKQLLAACDEL